MTSPIMLVTGIRRCGPAKFATSTSISPAAATTCAATSGPVV
ncbi:MULTISPECIES: hypothetical protein [unclassified Pseudonocardia]|nr:hypothetical protein [Pseudonocardia sp. Ae707_Ps1]